jgi:ATP-dependent Zn protease
LAWQADFVWIASLLHREGLVDELWPRIDEAKAKARAILSRENDAAKRVFEWLVEHERIDGDTFESLMRGGAR